MGLFDKCQQTWYITRLSVLYMAGISTMWGSQEGYVGANNYNVTRVYGRYKYG